VSPNGRIEQVVQVNGRMYGYGVKGYLVQNIKVDSRTSLYSILGDWFATLCAIVLIFAVLRLDVLAGRAFQRRRKTPCTDES